MTTEYYSTDKEKTEIKVSVKIKEDVEKRINWLTHNYKEEISAFLTGQIVNNEIVIDGLLFPKQDVSGSSVDVDGKNLIALRKEYGKECLRIVGHWHSHNTMGAFWSGTDEEFIKQYSITKKWCVFMVSSTKDKHRVLLTITEPFNMYIDNVGYSVLSYQDNNLKEEMQAVIKDKVIERKYTAPSTYGCNENYYIDCYGWKRKYVTTSDPVKRFMESNVKYDKTFKMVRILNVNSYYKSLFMAEFVGDNVHFYETNKGQTMNINIDVENKKQAKQLCRDIKGIVEVMLNSQVEEEFI